MKDEGIAAVNVQNLKTLNNMVNPTETVNLYHWAGRAWQKVFQEDWVKKYQMLGEQAHHQLISNKGETKPTPMTMNRLYDMSTLEAKMKISMSTEMSMVQFRNGNIGKMKET